MASTETTGFYKRIMEHLDTRMLFYEELAPPAIASIGSIIANQQQKREPFEYVMGEAIDLGLNITYVAPSGLAKSYAMKQFIHKTTGICPYKSVFRGKITEPGFVGTIKDGEEFMGDAFAYSDGILAFNEITNLFYAQQQDHSAELINQVMEALTEREVSKRLAAGVIEYPTLVTIWGGVQPKRFDFSQGLGRRFLFASRNWSELDLQCLKDMRMNRDKGQVLDLGEVEKIRNEFAEAKTKFNPKEIKWEDGFLKFLNEICESHLQMQLMEKAIIGLESIEQYENDVLVIRNNRINKDLIAMFMRMQQMVSEGSDIALMISILQSAIDDNKGHPVLIVDLYSRFKKFSYTLTGFQELMASCNKLKVLETTMKNKRQYVNLREDLRAIGNQHMDIASHMVEGPIDEAIPL